MSFLSRLVNARHSAGYASVYVAAQVATSFALVVGRSAQALNFVSVSYNYRVTG